MTDEEAWQTVADNLGLGYKLAGQFFQSRKKFGKHLGSAVHEELRSAVPELLLKAAKGFDPSKGYKFSTYAGTALWRGFISIEQYEQRRETSEYNDDRAYRDESLDRAEVMATLADTSLTERNKHIIYAYHVQGFEKQEIADMMGLPLTTIKVVLHKTVKKLTRELAPEDLRAEGPEGRQARRQSRPVRLPNDDSPLPSGRVHERMATQAEAESGTIYWGSDRRPANVGRMGAYSTMVGSILDQVKANPELAALKRRNQDRAAEDARAMELWYADLRRERE